MVLNRLQSVTTRKRIRVHLIDFGSPFHSSQEKKGQHSRARQIPSRGWPQTLLLIFPLQETFCVSLWPQIMLEAFSMMGEALRAEEYHTEEGCQAV
jgi:hypothetical protein